ncbi:MAG: S8 family serine peptidase, partial [Desulfobacterales bacterium]
STMYPARYSEVIAVAASDMSGYLAPYSNYDEEVDLMAPGSDVVSADITNGNLSDGFGYCNGSSMAAPHVTAAAALMLAIDPTLTNDDIQQILVDTADYYMEGFVGEVDLSKALDKVFSRLLENDPSMYDAKELKKLYKQQIKDKLASIDDVLWESGSATFDVGIVLDKLEDDKIKWKVTNNSDIVTTLETLTVNFPTEYGVIKELKLDGTIFKASDSSVYPGGVASGETIGASTWTNLDTSKRQLDPGETRTLEVVFTQKYTGGGWVDAGSATFDGTCDLSLVTP